MATDSLPGWKECIHRGWKWFRENAEFISHLIVIISLPIILLGGVLSYYQLKDYLKQPDIHLEFVYPTSLSVKIVNEADKIANRVVYGFSLRNLEQGKSGKILPLKYEGVDYVRPHSFMGPNVVMEYMTQQGLVKKGDHIFGSATVTCPDCKERRNYWLYIKHDYDGWYAEAIDDIPSTLILTDKFFDDPDSELAKLIPEKRRIPIK